MTQSTTTGNGQIPIGFDPGFGNTKAACVCPMAGRPVARLAAVPSVVGVGETDLGLLSLGALGRRPARRVARRPDRVAAGDGTTYLVGENVARYARPLERMDFVRLSDGPELRTLFYDVMFRLLGEGEHRARIMVGLPVEVMADRELAQATVTGLRRWVVGPHCYSVNGQQISLHISAVRAMAQPAGTFFTWGLDDAGRWMRDRAALKAPVAICDVGYNTVDAFTVEGGEVVGRFTGGDTVGMRRASELLIDAVRGNYGLSLSLHEADALLREKEPRLHTSGGEQDLRSQVAQALDSTAAAVVSFVERRWGNGRQFAHLLFTGGGAAALQDVLLRQYPQGVVLPNPVVANALGLARYAARVFGQS